jgi:hypothetical protein
MKCVIHKGGKGGLYSVNGRYNRTLRDTIRVIIDTIDYTIEHLLVTIEHY